MALNPQPAPIIIKRKKTGHGGHHGGAWKVAYADFVTAMMALFIVLWMMNTKREVQDAIGGYFRNPTGKIETGNGAAGSGQKLAARKEDMEKLKERIQNAFKKHPDFQKKLADKIKMTVMPEGLRIEFLENDKGVFFHLGNPVPTQDGIDLLTMLAAELGQITAKILVEGHTDSHPYQGQGSYSNWELSADRANAARKLMQGAGVRADQITQVRGYADQDLRDPVHPDSPSNRRITVVVLNERVDAPGTKVFAPASSPASATPNAAPGH